MKSDDICITLCVVAYLLYLAFDAWCRAKADQRTAADWLPYSPKCEYYCRFCKKRLEVENGKPESCDCLDSSSDRAARGIEV